MRSGRSGGPVFVSRARGRRYQGRGAFGMGRRRAGGGKIRLLIGLGIAGFALFSFLSGREYNELTGETQFVKLSPEEEIAMGLQAAPAMAAQHGGLDRSAADQARVDAIGTQILERSAARDTGWNFEFHLLADPSTVNAFALPGGQVFITRALYDRLDTDGEVAGVLGHEIGHVVARHSAQRIAKANFGQGLVQAILLASGSSGAAQAGQAVTQMLTMKYGRGDELQSDELGVRFLVESGYDPEALIEVMQVLAEASGGAKSPEFMSTHPAPENRIEKIREAIERYAPGGVAADAIR